VIDQVSDATRMRSAGLGLAPTDLAAVVDVLGDLAAVRPLGQLRSDSIELISSLVINSLSSWTEVDLRGPLPTTEVVVHPDIRVVIGPDRFAALNTAFDAHVAEHPVIRHYQRTGDGRPRTISEFLSEDEFHGTGLYQAFYGQPELSAEDQLSFVLPEADLVVGIALNRPERDFAGRDRGILNILRPHLVQAHRNSAAHERVTRIAAGLEEAVETKGEGLVLCSSRGGVEHLTPQASDMLKRYFSEVSADRLPEELTAWIARARSEAGPPWPYSRESDEGQLLVRVLPSVDGLALLLAERRGLPSRATLARLGLTARQAEVLALVSQGLSTKQIAARCQIRPRTVDKHVENALRVLGTESRLAAVNLIRQAEDPFTAPAL
jgi:DNA-binding CsgD family transcriptional regulator